MLTTTMGAHICPCTNSRILPQYVRMDKHMIFTVFMNI